LNIFTEDEIGIKTSWILLAFSLIVLIAMFYTIKPSLHGDGREYVFMSQSFVNHLTPNLKAGDIQSSLGLLNANGYTNNIDAYSGFFKSNSGEMYSYHFWFYSFICSIVQKFLKICHINQFRAMQVTNAILLLTSIWYAFLNFSSKDYKKKIFFLGFLTVNPILWYLIWTHPEVFSYSLVVISLTLYSNKKYKLSMLFSALASMQNPPLLVLNVVYIIKYLKENYRKLNIKDCFFAMLCCIPILIPSIFYYLNYGTVNLISKYGLASFKFVTFQKVFDQIFDLNMGMFPYMPIIMMIFFIAIIKNFIRKKFARLGWPIAILSIIILCTQTINWNSDCSGLMRYNVWIIPCIIYYVITQLDFQVKQLQTFLVSAFILQSALVYSFGGFSYNQTYMEFNKLSRVVLEHAPVLYSPNIETFNERINHTEKQLDYNSPIFYVVGNTTTKMWTNYNGVNYIKALYNINDVEYFDNKIKALKSNKFKFAYLNFKKGVLSRKKPEIIAKDGYKGDIIVKKNFSTIETYSTKDLFVEIKNESNIDWINFNEHRISISYHWLNQNNNIVDYNGVRTNLPEAILSNSTISLNMAVVSPDKAGNYVLELDMIQEGITWFSKKDNKTVKIPIVVTDKSNK